jgi:hypothetical protein
MVGVMVAVVADDQDQILAKQVSEGEVPVEFSPVNRVVMSDELAEKVCLFSEKDDISESIAPSVFIAAEVVITGKSAWELTLTEELPMKMNLLFQAEWIFIRVRTIDKHLIAVDRFKK